MVVQGFGTQRKRQPGRGETDQATPVVARDFPHTGELRRKQGQIVINFWLRQYNHTCRHQALGMRPLALENPPRNDP